MAKLTEAEKAQLSRPTSPGKQKEPRPPALPPRDYVAFATFASGATPLASKPARFQGEHWKL